MPIVVYTGKDLTRKEEAQLREVAQTIIIKDVRSPERLLDETTLFLHRVQSALPEHKRRMLEDLHHQRRPCSRARRCWSSTTTSATSSP